MTYLLTVVAREIALRTGAVAEVRDRDVHAEPIPYLGGLAMLGGLVAAYLVARELPFLSTSGPFVFRDAGIVLIAGALICAVGVLDDLFELDALTKLGGQVLAAGFLVVLRHPVLLLPRRRRQPVLPRPRPGRAADRSSWSWRPSTRSTSSTASTGWPPAWSASARWRSSSSATSSPRSTASPLATTGALLSAALAGACAGFLPHNFHPARLFMGDSGLDADRAGALGQRADPDRAVLGPDISQGAERPRPACS